MTRGAGFAAAAAVGTLAGSLMQADFALGFARAARHGGPVTALSGAMAAAAALASLTLLFGHQLASAGVARSSASSYASRR